MPRSKIIRYGGAVALVVGLVGIGVYLRLGPWYGGMPLNYWLNQLKPAVWSPRSTRLESKSFADLAAQDAESTRMHERASNVLNHAGAECLPALLSRLTEPDQSGRMAFFERWAYKSRFVSYAPMADSDDSQVRRGQAVTAIVLLGDRAASLVPQLFALAARGNDDDPVTVAASIALSRIAPDEFRRVRSTQFSPSRRIKAQEAEPSGATNGSQPTRLWTNQTSGAFVPR